MAGELTKHNCPKCGAKLLFDAEYGIYYCSFVGGRSEKGCTYEFKPSELIRKNTQLQESEIRLFEAINLIFNNEKTRFAKTGYKSWNFGVCEKAIRLHKEALEE